jgi:hypothetical protein
MAEWELACLLDFDFSLSSLRPLTADGFSFVLEITKDPNKQHYWALVDRKQKKFRMKYIKNWILEKTFSRQASLRTLFIAANVDERQV